MTLATIHDSRPGRSRGSRLGAAVLAALGAAGLLTASANATAAATTALTLVRFTETGFPSADLVVKQTNACVDAASSADLATAEQLCTAAIHAARTARTDVLAAAYAGEALRQDLAIAYNNRAVVRRLAGDLVAAKKDSDRAVALAGTALRARDTSPRIAAGPAKSVRVAEESAR